MGGWGGRQKVGGAGREGVSGGGRMEPAGLNSTAEPLTPTIHQCRGVTRLGQGYVTEGEYQGELVTGETD